MRKYWSYVFILAGFMVVSIHTDSHPIAAAQTFAALQMDSSSWQQKVFPEGSNITIRQAAGFDFFTDSTYGPVIAIGPWQAGRWNCRLEYKSPLSFTTGTIRGVYKTENLPPLAVFVRVEYYVSGTRTQQQKYYYLPNTNTWQSFEIITRHPLSSANQISVAFGLATKTTGRVLFGKLEVSPITPAESFPDDPGHVTRAKGKEGNQDRGFHRLRQDNGTWWFVDPQGNDWYSIATPTRSWASSATQTDGRTVAQLMRDTGFNSVAGWSNIYRWRDLNDTLQASGESPFGVFYAVESDKFTATFDRLEKADGTATAPIGSGHAFPDPFDPAWQQAYRQRVQDVANVVAKRPWFVAWFADNELDMNDLHRHVYSKHCAQAFKVFLSDRYTDIGALNQAWGTSFTSFDNLVSSRPDPELHAGPMFKDFKDFEQEIIKQYSQVTSNILRSADPDHLLFTPRFYRGASEVWLAHLAAFSSFDAVALNFYSGNYTWDPGLEKSGRQLLDEIYARTRKPVLITEWSVPALDSGLYQNENSLDHSWPQVVSTQEQRARQAAKVAVDYANIPYVIGSHWFIWYDFNNTKRQANRGLFDSHGNPWGKLLFRLKEAHRRIATSFYPYQSKRPSVPTDVRVIQEP